MIAKEKEKLKAIELRKRGLSYSEILTQIPVAKSSLGLWLQSVGLSKKQKQRLTEKKLASARRGALKKKEQRIERSYRIKTIAEGEIGPLSKRELWLIGIALYWAEGAKEKEWNPGSRAQFSNSDPNMIRFFMFWLLEICKIARDRINPEIYIHESHKDRISIVIKFWSKETSLSIDKFRHVYFKKNKINTKRKNIGDNYYGVLRLSMLTSSELNRKISGWTNGIVSSIPKK